MRLRAAMIAVAVLAVLLAVGVGLWRRARRFEALALQYGREANRNEVLWEATGAKPIHEPDEIMERIHWNDAVADEYRRAAARPWLPFDPDPRQVLCKCGFHTALRARAAK
jgi:hypothetical protein